MFGLITTNAYGSIEACYFFFPTTSELSTMGSVGRLIPDHNIKSVDENDNEVKKGEYGELHVKGPYVTKGYYKNPEETVKAFTKDGYYLTGDMLMHDSDGLFWFLYRSKNLRVYQRIYIYPSDIENIAVSHPKVSDCAVIGLFCTESFEEFPMAYVTLVEEEDYENKDEIEKEILDFEDEQLHKMKQIRAEVIGKKEFERKVSGKIIYFVLKQGVEIIRNHTGCSNTYINYN